MIGWALAAYFVFALETVQTALTGADLYHWFIAGFGDAERLSHPHLLPIDTAIMTAIISVIVQGYFCYRIWVVNNRLGSSWLCWIIAVVCIVFFLQIFLQFSELEHRFR